MTILKAAATAAIFAVAGGVASASPLTFNGSAGSSDISVTGTGIGTPAQNTSFGGNASAFKMSDATNALGLGNDFIAFCIDLFGTIGSGGDYEITSSPFLTKNMMTAYQIDNVNDLFSSSFGSVDVNNNVHAAAFQMAIWDVAYETDDTGLGLSVGKVQGFGDDAVEGAAVTALANTFLADTKAYAGPDLFKVSFLEATAEGQQDLVTATPVPVPAAGLLLIGGLGALGALKRRKAKRAA